MKTIEATLLLLCNMTAIGLLFFGILTVNPITAGAGLGVLWGLASWNKSFTAKQKAAKNK